MDENQRAARYTDLFLARHEHAETCSYCPVCAGIEILRNGSPEVMDHLAGAARELISALRVILDEAEAVLTAVEERAPRPPAGETESDEDDIRAATVRLLGGRKHA